METLLLGLKGAEVYIDDILISSKMVEKHLEILEEVLKRLQAANLRLKRARASFYSVASSTLATGLTKMVSTLLQTKSMRHLNQRTSVSYDYSSD